MVYWIYRDAIGEWRWYLKYENRNKIADSGEGYQSKAHCEHGHQSRQRLERRSGL